MEPQDPNQNQNFNEQPKNIQQPPSVMPTQFQPTPTVDTPPVNTFQPSVNLSQSTISSNPSPSAQQQGLSSEGEKSFIGTFLLSWLFGSFGADRFYIGKIGTAILKLVTFGGIGIWATIDLIRVCFGKFKDKQGRQLKGYEENKGWAKVAGIILAIVNTLAILIAGGIFLSLVLTTSSGIQDKAHDTERKTDIDSIHGQIETYWAKNGQYPSLAQMNDQTFRSQNLQSLTSDNFKDPSGTNDQLSSNKLHAYSYNAYDNNGTICDVQKVKCSKYTLQAQLESGGTYLKNQIN